MDFIRHTKSVKSVQIGHSVLVGTILFWVITESIKTKRKRKH